MKESIAILWDIENVTPSSNSLFVGGLIDYATELGRISVAIAYGDWTKKELKGISEVLAENSFEMMHVPHSRKNSSDITLITDAIEIIHQYPHIKKIVLVTGDADFRPLLQSLRKHGIETTIICDAKSASEDLLLLADSYKDYRELVASAGDDPVADSVQDEKDGRKQAQLNFAEAVELLKESVQILNKSQKASTLGAVKIRTKLLNQTFSEKGANYNYRSWKDFVLAAAKQDKSIELTYTEKDIVLMIKPVSLAAGSGEAAPPSETIKIPEVIRELLVAIRNCQRSRGGPNVKEPNPWIPYSVISQYLIDVGLDLRQHGYTRIRTLVEAAEKRGLVETHNENQHWVTRLSNEGALYC